MTEQPIDREEMIKRIYEEIADKTLSFGCVIDVQGSVGRFGGDRMDIVQSYIHNGFGTKIIGAEFSVVGHPVMIGDVLDWYDNNFGEGKDMGPIRAILHTMPNKELHPESYDDQVSDAELYMFLRNELLRLYREKRKPIEEQSESCIKFVYSLLPNTKDEG